jgi:hypothetical protein
MSTNGLTSWAVDLNNIGAIYPFQGSEVLLTLLLLVFWIGFHVLQTRAENREFDRDVAADQGGEETRRLIESY